MISLNILPLLPADNGPLSAGKSVRVLAQYVHFSHGVTLLFDHCCQHFSIDNPPTTVWTNHTVMRGPNDSCAHPP